MKNRGFTLIELLVVIAIIGVLISFIIPALSGAMAAAKVQRCAMNLRSFSQGFSAFVATSKNNRHPVPDLGGDYFAYLPSHMTQDSTALPESAPPLDKDGTVIKIDPWACPLDKEMWVKTGGGSYHYNFSEIGLTSHLLSQMPRNMNGKKIPIFHDIGYWHPNKNRNEVYDDGSIKSVRVPDEEDITPPDGPVIPSPPDGPGGPDPTT